MKGRHGDFEDEGRIPSSGPLCEWFYHGLRLLLDPCVVALRDSFPAFSP